MEGGKYSKFHPTITTEIFFSRIAGCIQPARMLRFSYMDNLRSVRICYHLSSGTPSIACNVPYSILVPSSRHNNYNHHLI